MAVASSDKARRSRWCIYCGSDINKGAKICPKCSSYQHRWRNELKFWSGITSLITLIVSGLAVTYTLGYLIYQRFTIEDLVVSEFHLLGDSTIWNQSDSDILVTNIHIHSDKPDYDLQWDINRIVESKASSQTPIPGISEATGELAPLKVRLTELTKTQWHGTVAEWFDGVRAGDYIANIAPAELLAFQSDNVDAKSNMVPDFMFSEGQQYKQLKGRHGDGLAEIAGICSVKYIKLSRPRSLQFPCMGVLRRLKPAAT